MRPRDKVGGKAAKPQRPKTLKGHKTARVRSSRIARKETNVARLTRERDEALEQRTATAEVLKLISRSTFDLQAVLDTLVESAARLCDADRGLVFRREGSTYKIAAHYGFSREFREFHESHPIVPGSGTAVGRAALEGKTVHIPDVLADPEYTFLEAQKLGRYRTNLAVPLLREGNPIGALSLTRSEPLPFTDKQIELVETFADQAVIAIENVRLFDELSESLEQQTATSEVLRVISRSPTDAQPVFDTIAKSVARLCKAQFCHVFRFDGELVHFAAEHGLAPEAVEATRRAYPIVPGRASAAARSILSGAVEEIPDVLVDHDYAHGSVAKTTNFRSIVAVPMLKDGRPIGAIAIARSQTGHFPERQIELLRTFADQAVIAIENARLFDDVQARTRELSESLEHQTATSEVLGVISRSPGELEPVFQAMLANATRICEAKFGMLYLWEGEGHYRVAALHGAPPRLAEERRRGVVVRPPPGSALGRIAQTKHTVHIADSRAEKNYLDVPPTFTPP